MTQSDNLQFPLNNNNRYFKRDLPDIHRSFENFADDGLSLPPINTEPAVISVKTVERNSGRRSSRRPLPVNTIDWVSTPRSQLSAFSGMYFLSNVDQLQIQQVVDLSTLLGQSDNGSQYRVKVPKAETLFLAVEDSTKYQRLILRSSRKLTLNVLDPSGENAFTMRKNLGWGWLPGFFHKLTVESYDLIGSVEQNFSIIGMNFTVYDAKRNALCYIFGPSRVLSCCISRQMQFQIVSLDKCRQIASLIRHWDHHLVDYSLLLTFSPDVDVKLKGLLLGATFLLEFLFFERM